MKLNFQYKNKYYTWTLTQTFLLCILIQGGSLSAVFFHPAVKMKKRATVNERASWKTGRKNFRKRLSKSGRSY